MFVSVIMLSRPVDFGPAQKLVYNKNFDHALRNLARANKGAEECAENECIKEEWDKVIAVRDNEILEANVKDKMDVDKEDKSAEGDTALSQMRRPATEFTENSQEYWNSLANSTVRRYVSLQVLPSTQQQIVRAIQQSTLQEVLVPEGQKSCVVWFDLDLCGETTGVNSQVGLRRNPIIDGTGEFRNIIQAVMLARGAQVKSDAGECTVPGQSEIICIHSGDTVNGEVRKCFRLLSAKHEGTDCEEKLISVVFAEDTMRSRKKRIRGDNAYNTITWLQIYSAQTLVPTTVPEKRRVHFAGYNLGNVIGWVDAIQPGAMWETTRDVKEKILGGKANKLTSAEEAGALFVFYVFFFKAL